MGFTLIEVSIAVTLLALMAMILYGTFYLGHRAVEKAEARFEESQKIRSVGDLLAGYIRSAYPYRSSPQDASVFFAGAESQLEFVSALSSGMGGRGMSRVSIAWADGGDEAGLLTLDEEIPVRLQSQEPAGGYRNRVVLSEGVRGFRIDYLDPQSEEERWVERWDGSERKRLPRAVRFTHQAGNGQEVQWVFPIMMSVLAP